MNLQEFKDALYNAGWNNPNDAQGKNIEQLYVKNFPKDHVIEELLKDNQKYQDALEFIAGLDWDQAAINGGLYEAVCVAKRALLPD